jgi:hypothetical protein
LASRDVQAQTSRTNAAANGQLTTSNTANALSTATGAASGATTNGQRQSGNQSPTTGVICIELMTATFCNVPSGPNTNGYGSPGGAGSGGGTGPSGGTGSAASASSGGAGANTSSIPACGSFPSPNELCN